MKALIASLLLLAPMVPMAQAAKPDLDSNVVGCHRKYWEKKTGRWTYILCVFPDGSTALFMRVPEHATSTPVMTPSDTRGQLEWMSPGVIQIPELKPVTPPDSDDDDNDPSSKEAPR